VKEQTKVWKNQFTPLVVKDWPNYFNKWRLTSLYMF